MEKHQWSQIIGGAVLISIACLDPGNLLGDIQAAQALRYSAFFLLLLAHFVLYFVQELTIIISVHFKLDIGQLIRQSYPPWLRIVIWLNLEAAIVAADL